MENNPVYVVKVKDVEPLSLAKPYVGEYGIYGVNTMDPRFNVLIMTKEQFIEAYNKWIATPND